MSPRIVRLPALCLSLALGALPAAAQDERVISVNGRGEVAAAPDMAVISLGVVEEAATAGDAMRAANAAAGAVLSRLEALDIAARDIQTSELRLTPVWAGPDPERDLERRITGFQASNHLTVRLRDLSTLGEVLDAVVAEGANRFSGLRFTVAEPDELMEEARRAAVADATAKARTLAEAAGEPLGRVQRITEHGGGAPRPMMMEAARSDAGGVPVAPGEIEMTVEVTIDFAIAEVE